jgi:hypothetical protein
MDRDTRLALILVAAILVVVIAVGLWEILRWRRERDAQCTAVTPLVNARANIEEIRRLHAAPPVEYSERQADALIRAFGPQADIGRSVSQYLIRGRKALLFPENNSVMLVYFDENGRAFRAECFLQ